MANSKIVKYHSKYTSAIVTPANHIVEILMERKAAKEGKKLVSNFWMQPAWRKVYNLAVVQVSALLNAYSEKAVLAGINRVKWAWSVNTPAVKQAIIEEEAKLKLLEERKENSISETINVVMEPLSPDAVRPSFKKSSLCNLD